MKKTISTNIANDTLIKLTKSAAVRGLSPAEALKIIATKGILFYRSMVGATIRS